MMGNKGSSNGSRDKDQWSSRPFVYVSYAYGHRPNDVRKLASLLRPYCNVWIDYENMKGGGDLEQLVQAIDSSDVMVVCHSLKYDNSLSCSWELETANKREKPLIFVKLQQDQPPTTPLIKQSLANWPFHVQFYKSQTINEVVPKLLALIQQQPSAITLQIDIREAAESVDDKILFISYAKKTRGNEVVKMANFLKTKNFKKIWIDETEVRQKLGDDVMAGIAESDLVLICFSDEYVQSDYCMDELCFAKENKKPILPLNVQGKGYEPHDRIKFRIRDIVWRDYFGDKKQIDDIYLAICKFFGD